jgi:hypothetical protein
MDGGDTGARGRLGQQSQAMSPRTKLPASLVYGRSAMVIAKPRCRGLSQPSWTPETARGLDQVYVGAERQICYELRGEVRTVPSWLLSLPCIVPYRFRDSRQQNVRTVTIHVTYDLCYLIRSRTPGRCIVCTAGLLRNYHTGWSCLLRSLLNSPHLRLSHQHQQPAASPPSSAGRTVIFAQLAAHQSATISHPSPAYGSFQP